MNSRDDNEGRAGEREFTEQARRLFGESVDDLDGRTRSRLNQGRQQALAAASRPGVRSFLGGVPGWLPAGAAAAVAVLAVMLWNVAPQPDTGPVPAVASDFEILMDDEELEMLEDLEFYSWLELDAEADGGDEHVG